MGKKYYCDYCDKRFKDDVKIRKKHIEGLQHQILRKEHYQKFKDPAVILEEERIKKPCLKFQPQNNCRFGVMCRFSHYTIEQLKMLEQQVQQKQQAREWRQNSSNEKVILNRKLIDDFLRNRKRIATAKKINKLIQSIWKQSLTKHQASSGSLQMPDVLLTK